MISVWNKRVGSAFAILDNHSARGLAHTDTAVDDRGGPQARELDRLGTLKH